MTLRADYVRQIVSLYPPGGTPIDPVSGAFVYIEAYDGVGAAGGGLNAGEVHLIFGRDITLPGAPSFPGEFQLWSGGFHAVGFNTDLALKPGQITGPKGWAVRQDLDLAGWDGSSMTGPSVLHSFGTFSWSLGTVLDLQGYAEVLISGLGKDATPAHFIRPSRPTPGLTDSANFAAHWVDIRFGNSTSVSADWFVNTEGIPGVPAAPEPTAFALGALGLGGVLVAQVRRRVTS